MHKKMHHICDILLEHSKYQNEPYKLSHQTQRAGICIINLFGVKDSEMMTTNEKKSR